MSKIFLTLTFILILFYSKNSESREIIASNFFIPPDMVNVKLSPDGKHIATQRINNEKSTIDLLDSETLSSIKIFNPEKYGENETHIGNFSWLDNQHIAIELSEKKQGIEDLLDTKRSNRLIILNINKTGDEQIKSVRTKGSVTATLPSKPGTFWYSKSGVTSKVYSIDISLLHEDKKQLSRLDKIDGGQFIKSNVIKKVSGYAIQWFFSSEKEIKSVIYFSREKILTLAQYNDDESLTTLKTWREKDKKTKKKTEIEKKNLFPVALADENYEYYCLDRNEENSKTVYRVNFKNNTEKIAYESSAYEIVDLIQDHSGRLIGVEVLKNGNTEYEFIHSKQLGEKKPSPREKISNVIDTSLNGDTAILYKENSFTPGKFYIKTANNERHIGGIYPYTITHPQTRLIQTSVNVNDLKIPLLLTVPEAANKHPLIVMPHGGPIGVHDDASYDRITQFFAVNNYAVLRVNFRGSSGYSTELEDAGKKQWGKLMLRDIVEATKLVSSRYEIDKNRICIFGMSYGGYAAATLLTQEPTLFKCGVTVSGVLDIPLFLNFPRLKDKQKLWTKEYVGDVKTELNELIELSPAYMAEKLSRPILVAHGEEDRVVDVEHAYRYKLMLEKYDKSYEWYIDTKATHHFSSTEQRIELFTRVKDFIDKNI